MAEPETTPEDRAAGISRRKLIRNVGVGGALVWAAPAVVGVSAASAQTGSPQPGGTTLRVDKRGPAGAFTNQEFDFVIEVFNTGTEVATDVVVSDLLPSSGSFVSSTPAPTTTSPTVLTFNLGNLAVGASALVTIRWKAPANDTTLTNAASAVATNAPIVNDSVSVPVGTQTVTTGGATAAGTGLRNRPSGSVAIVDVPAGETVTRAVLVWALLYQGATPPPGTITFNGTPVTADLTATTSGNLCWGDAATIGYAADVTALVTGNGTYTLTNVVNGTTRIDSNPAPVFPVTDGATLVVFYGGGSTNAQVLSDFSYSTNTVGAITRSFAGITSTGAPARVLLAGPDGQNNGGEIITFAGHGSFSTSDLWNGSDPQTAPDFPIGNLWDTDPVDVTAVLPAGQTTLTVSASPGGDCIGFNAAVLIVN